jgi:hypothetical protein
MMKPVLFAAAALFAAASPVEARVAPPLRTLEPAPGPAQGFALSAAANCAITVAFTSYGAGIDGPTRARMERVLRADRRVRTFTSRPWGREGEVTFCISARLSADVYRIFRDLQNMVPRRPRGPVQVQQHPRRATLR